MGNLTARKEIIRTIIGNIALVQVQATVASFLVAMFAVTIGAIKHGHFIFDQFMLLVAAAMFTATTSCFVLGKVVTFLHPLMLLLVGNAFFQHLH